MREYALPFAGVLLNLAVNLSIARDWTKRLPGWIVVFLWGLSLVPLGYWVWTDPRIFTFLRTRYAISMTVVVLLGALCGGGLAGMTYAFWFHSRTQTSVQPSNSKPQEQTPGGGSTETLPAAPAPTPPARGGNAAVGNLTQGPGSIAQIGGKGNQATINNYGPPEPKIAWSIVEASPDERATHPLTAVRISVDRAMESAKFAVICDRPCLAFSMPREESHLGMVNNRSWGQLRDMPNVAAFSINEPNPLPPDSAFVCVVESADDTPIKIIDVKRLEVKKDRK